MVSLQKVYQTWICIMIYHDISQIIISWKQYSTATHMASEKAYCVSLCVASTSHVRHGQMVSRGTIVPACTGWWDDQEPQRNQWLEALWFIIGFVIIVPSGK